MGAVSAALEPKSRVVDNDEWAIAEAGVPPGATWRSAVDRCPANLEHSPAAAPLDCAWPGASAGGGTLRRHKSASTTLEPPCTPSSWSSTTRGVASSPKAATQSQRHSPQGGRG